MKKDLQIWELFNKENVGIYNIEEAILLAVNIRGGYFLSNNGKTVINVVFKDNGYGNCIMGDLHYMKRVIYFDKSKDYRFTEDGYNLLELKKIERENSNFRAEIICTIDEIKNENKKREIMDTKFL